MELQNLMIISNIHPKRERAQHSLSMNSSMAAAAATSSIASLFSFFTSSPPKTTPPSQVSSAAAGSRERWAPLVSSNESAVPPQHSVVCPSLAYANTLFYRSGYNVQVMVDDNEPEERLIGRFKREVMRAGVIQECKRRRYFENKQEEKKRRARDAAKRNRRRRPQMRNGPQEREKERAEAATKKRVDEESDNWDLPQGDIP